MRINAGVRQRRRLSMTSLIDVVFLLLLFLMLTSTFSRYAETEITPPSGGQGINSSNPAIMAKPLEDGWLINGLPVSNGELEQTVKLYREKGAERVLLNVDAELTSQRLVDALEGLRRLNMQVAISR